MSTEKSGKKTGSLARTDSTSKTASRVKRTTVASLEKELRATQEELEHLKQAHAGVVTKLEKLEERLESAPPVEQADASDMLSEKITESYIASVKPVVTIAANVWRIYKYQIFGVLVLMDLIAWLASWDTVFSFFFGLIMLIIFLKSLQVAVSGFRDRYLQAQKRLQGR